LKRWEAYTLPLLAAIALLLLWHWSVIWTHTQVFPKPADVQRGVFELFRKGLLLGYTRDSLYRVGVGYGAAVLLGIPLGLVLGWYPTAAQTTNPVIQILRPISPLAWIPVSVLWFGVTDAAAIFLIFLASLFPIVLATMDGGHGAPGMFVDAGRNFGLSTPALLSRVVFPAALPRIIIGLRIALGVAWLVVVAAEMIAVDSGLGYLIIDSRNAGKRYHLVVAGMLLIGVIGLCLDTGIRQLEKFKFLRWGFYHE